MRRSSHYLIARFWLVLVAVVCLALPRGNAQSIPSTNAHTGLTVMRWHDLFANAVLDHPSVKLPDQGPWTISQSDLKQPVELILDLVKHSDPMFLFLWNSLSNETRTALQGERAKMGVPGVYYKAGSSLPQLIADLNSLIQGKVIYDEKAFATIKPYLSGDTRKLLSQTAATNLTRLNRLLIEDAFPLDIQRRPKILFDSNANNYVFVDFVTKAVTVYNQDGRKKLTADLGPTLDGLSRRSTSYRVEGVPAGNFNIGIWDIAPRPGELLVHVRGVSIYSISLTTGEVTGLPHF